MIHARGLILEGVFDQMLNTGKERFRAMGVPATRLAHLLVIWNGLQFSFWPFAHNPSTYARALEPTRAKHLSGFWRVEPSLTKTAT